MTRLTCCNSGEPGEHEAGCPNHPGFDLMPDDVAATMPKLYAQDGAGDNAVIHVKLFLPGSGWTWYLTEYDPEEDRAFGLVHGDELELGYVSLAELRGIRVGPGWRVERDLHWTWTTVGRVRAAIRGAG